MRDHLLRRLLGAVAARLPTRTFHGNGGPYLSKHLLYESGPGKDSWRVHLHRFHRGDEDPELHNHPWAWAVSLVLAGGYAEHRLAHDGVRVTRRPPGSVVRLDPSTFHRVEMLDGECWTLFVSGSVIQSWGFLARRGFVPWREFIAGKGLVPQ